MFYILGAFFSYTIVPIKLAIASYVLSDIDTSDLTLAFYTPLVFVNQVPL